MTKKPNSSDDRIHLYVEDERPYGCKVAFRHEGDTDADFARNQRVVDLFESARTAYGSDEIVVHQVTAADEDECAYGFNH